MKDGDRRTIISSIISQQTVWQCTIVHGRCKNLSWNLVTSKSLKEEIDPKDVDADYVFDCRGKPKDFADYDELKIQSMLQFLANQIGIQQRH